MYKVIVIADDFTGSNDTGVQLVKHGYFAITLTDTALAEKYEDVADALVIDTETRGVPASSAYEKLKEISKIVGEYKEAVVYKKIDSTLRGNIGAEIRALREGLKPDLTVFAPAFPKNGRTTERGVHFLKGVPIDKTELARDPKNPVTTADVKKILVEGLGVPVKHKVLEEINGDLKENMEKELGEYDVFSFDAKTDDDLIKIATVVLNLGRKTLWVGSAGLAEALMASLEKKEGKKPVLIIAGSVSQVTRRQVFKALEDSRIVLVKLDAKRALSHPQEEIDRVRKIALDHMSAARDVIIASAVEEDAVSESIAAGMKKGLSPIETSEILAQVLGEIACSIVAAKKPAGLVLTGGDTAIHVVKRLAAAGCRITSELEPGIPELALIGGAVNGLRAVTKAGAFGSDESILNSVKFLRGDGR
ncbi:four-carbon acid sugar kinase family protein [Thermosediminibacter oceani]|uniref:Type III effector Hrp-dependent outers domain protein n=1 Tax=Thermosediminibacter oceani (strain ATCC BAA-1034 / DSM 16646 / JW/IW-1228P) TaxID=555079 RepID=D9S1Z8_THEOJ|nr:four-carbon acid sugar kinase family protein [Thermosediminibacter oceani]ADL07425.1 type III effector Hrp-dependent outers domain protein [Thermosediminibacter oceani DSM 16646]